MNLRINQLSQPLNDSGRQAAAQLASALALGTTDTNSLLRGWGLNSYIAPISLMSDESKAVLEQLDLLMTVNTVVPVVAMDCTGMILAMNDKATELLAKWQPPPAQISNLFVAVLNESGFKNQIDNWQQLAPKIVRHIQQGQSLLQPDSAEWAALNKLLLQYRDIPAATDKQGPVIGFEIDLKITGEGPDQIQRFISHPTTLGSPHDGTGQVVRIETFHPRDAGR